MRAASRLLMWVISFLENSATNFLVELLSELLKSTSYPNHFQVPPGSDEGVVVYGPHPAAASLQI